MRGGTGKLISCLPDLIIFLTDGQTGREERDAASAAAAAAAAPTDHLLAYDRASGDVGGGRVVSEK